MGLRVAIVGATGNVGREMLDILDERKFPIDEVFALASSRSKGNAVQFGNKELTIEDLSEFDFSKADIALFSAGGKISEEFAGKAAKHCLVIDNSSFYRMDPDVPLVVPQVNSNHLNRIKKKYYCKSKLFNSTISNCFKTFTRFIHNKKNSRFYISISFRCW